MSEHALPAVEPDTPDTDTAAEDRTEARAQAPAGGLQVEDRAAASEPARRGLADEFRSRGFPGETATLAVGRVRGPRHHLDRLGRQHQQAAQAQAGPFGADERYAWPAFAAGRRRRRGHVGRRDDPDRPLARDRRERGPRDRRRDRQAGDRFDAHDRHDRVEAGRHDPDEHPERLSRAAGVQHHDRERPAARDQRRARQADPRRGRHLRVPGTRHRRAARLDPQSDDDDPGVRLQPGHAAAAAGQHGSARHPASHAPRRASSTSCSPRPSSRRATSSAWRCGSRRPCRPRRWSTRRRSGSCTPPRSLWPASRRTPAPRTARTCGWSSTPCSASSAPPPPSGSPPPNGRDQRQEESGPEKKAGPPKPKPISKNPAASLALLHRARRKAGR